MLYTGKGDKGTTKLFDSKEGERISKSSLVTQALGSFDEANSFIGLCKVKTAGKNLQIKDGRSFAQILHGTQENLFIIQAEMAGSDKAISLEKVKEIEELINGIEKELPPIKTFFISGGSEVAALLDFGRTLVRKAERTMIAVIEAGRREMKEESRTYINRLSSLLYALARLANHKSGIKEQAPEYK